MLSSCKNTITFPSSLWWSNVGARPVWTHVQLRAGRTNFRVLGTKVKNDLNVDEIGTTACLKNSLLCVQLGVDAAFDRTSKPSLTPYDREQLSDERNERGRFCERNRFFTLRKYERNDSLRTRTTSLTRPAFGTLKILTQQRD